MTKIGVQTHGVNQSIIRKGLRGGGIAKRGTGVALKGGGRAALRFGGGRTDLLEELGRVEGERSNPNRRAEISRVHSELNRGYAKGGRAGFKHGDYVKKTEEQKKKGRQDLIDTVRKGGIGSDRVTANYRNKEGAFKWLKDPEQGEKTWKEAGRLYHNKGGRATHGYGKAYMKGGKVK